MAEKFTHPTVQRGTVWWSTHMVIIAVVVAALVLAAFMIPSTGLTIGACVAVVVGALLIFMATKQIKALRHEYRYDNNEDLQTPQ